MEIKMNITREQADQLLQLRLAAGAVEVDSTALITALNHIRSEKVVAIDRQDFDEAASWRDNEKNVIAALGGLGLAQPEGTRTEPIIQASDEIATISPAVHDAEAGKRFADAWRSLVDPNTPRASASFNEE